jgi:Uma2 family endonuclease
MASILIPPPVLKNTSGKKSSEIYYPDSDGEPVANNTEHYELIAATKSGLDKLFAERDDVFVAADLFWYPVEGNPKIAVAPDVMVAFGRPPGARSSYKQWEENDTPFHVVFEFLSDSNTTKEMARKAMFFDRYGAEEYYVYDMDSGVLDGFIRYGGELSPIEGTFNGKSAMEGWVSPRLGIRFEVEWQDNKSALVLYNPDGTRFLSYLEVIEQLDSVKIELDSAKVELDSAKVELDSAKVELDSAKKAISDISGKLSSTEEQNKLLREKLRALGVEAE